MPEAVREIAWVEDFLRQGAIVSVGEEVWLGWGKHTWSSHHEPRRAAFFAPHFFLDNSEVWLHPEHTCRMQRDVFEAAISLFVSEPIRPRWKPFDRTTFDRIFADLIDEIHAGRIEKCVPAIVESANTIVSPAHRARLIGSLLRNSRGLPLSIYGFWERDRGVLGATPEVLFEKAAGGTLVSMALAGTQCGTLPSGILLASDKDRREHDFVVQDIARSLAVFGTVKTKETEVLRLPTLSHLYTPIEVQLKADYSFMELVRCLHPTPAVGGVPRAAAWSFLKSLQSYFDRERFGAPFGAVCEDGHARCLVAIRGVQWSQEELRMGAGCGIVAQSNVDSEWQELQLKLTSIKTSMGL